MMVVLVVYIINNVKVHIHILLSKLNFWSAWVSTGHQ